jgi:rod shape-determining protein MreD
MKTGFLFFFIALILAILLQTTVFSHFEIYGVVPDLVLAVVILAGLSFDWRPTLFLALSGGLLLDFFSAGPFGIFALTFLIIAFCFSFLKSYLFTQANIFVFLIAVLIGTIFQGLMAVGLSNFFFLVHISVAPIPWRENLFFALPIELAYNLVIATIVFWIFNWRGETKIWRGY